MSENKELEDYDLTLYELMPPTYEEEKMAADAMALHQECLEAGLGRDDERCQQAELFNNFLHILNRYLPEPPTPKTRDTPEKLWLLLKHIANRKLPPPDEFYIITRDSQNQFVATIILPT